MSHSVHVLLLVVCLLATCVWIGGYVAIVVVALTSTVLPAEERVRFFRSFGRSYLIVGGSALVVALGTGAGLLSTRPWDGLATAAVVVAAVLVVALAAGVVQARRMTRVRATALAAPDEPGPAARVRRGARAARGLRALIGLLSVVLVVLGVLLAT